MVRACRTALKAYLKFTKTPQQSVLKERMNAKQEKLSRADLLIDEEG
jgi:hypothetical protein